MIHLLIFPAWSPSDNGSAPAHAVAYAQLLAARSLPPELGGLKMGGSDEDLDAAVKIGEAFTGLQDPQMEGRLRPEGGYAALSAHAKNRLLLYWKRDGQNGPEGLRALLGDSRATIIAKVEEYLKSENVREMEPDEYADWKSSRDA